MSGWKLHHWALLIIGVGATGALTYSGVKADRMARIGAGYKAKIACSEIFLAGRDADYVIANEFNGMDPAMDFIKVNVDADRKETSAAGPLGLGRARAVYRDGYGCTLANGGRVKPLPAPTPALAADPWPEARPVSGEAILRIDYAALDAALNDNFNDPIADNRSLVVIVDGKLVDERYADGFTKDTPFLSWSMAKSVTATLVGAAVLQGHIDLAERAPVASWRNDPQRGEITWDDLLHMQSGLQFEEEYGKTRSDVNRMLFETADTGAAAENAPAAYDAGTRWYYSSGETNLVSKLLRLTLTEKGVDYHNFGREKIFEPVGAASVVMEPDAAGNFIGSSYIYATARDWARLGQLYLQDGVWNGARLLPEGWAQYVAEPAAHADGQYGAHFWLNRSGAGEREQFFTELPEEMYFMAGHEGQYVFIFPSKRMVVVRTGMTRGSSGMKAVAPMLNGIYEAVGNLPISDPS